MHLSTGEGAEILTLGGRLREERDRLGLSQTAFSAIAGASKRTQIEWEKDVGSPNGADLERFGRAGVDVLYVVTGKRVAESRGQAIDVPVLRQVIEGVDEVIARHALRVKPADKAVAISMLYVEFTLVGKVEKSVIERRLKLVA